MSVLSEVFKIILLEYFCSNKYHIQFFSSIGLRENMHKNHNSVRKIGVFIAVDEDVLTRDPRAYSDFRGHVLRTLGDPRGWAKYGYYFRELTEKPRDNSGNIFIRLSAAETVKKECGFIDMSCCDMVQKNILINYTNWMTCGRSTLSRDRYRTYVINHEVGHALGLDHAKCAGAGKHGSVMMQMTRGPAHIHPCIENEWPLDPAEYNEMQNMVKKYQIKFGGSPATTGFADVIVIAIVILIIIALIAMSIRLFRADSCVAMRSRAMT